MVEVVEVRHRGPVISPGRVQQPCKDVLLAVGWWWWWQVVVERRWYLVAPGSGPVAPSQDPGQPSLPSHLLSSGNWSGGLQAADTRPKVQLHQLAGCKLTIPTIRPH